MTPHASALAGPAYLVSVPSTKKNGTAPSLRPPPPPPHPQCLSGESHGVQWGRCTHQRDWACAAHLQTALHRASRSLRVVIAKRRKLF
jgi:hypothetical protein